MKIQDFNFHLPRELIASNPLEERTSSRLLLVDRKISDQSFEDLPNFLKPNDVLVINETAVFKARLIGRKVTGAKVEFLVAKKIDSNRALVLTKSNSQLKEGDKIYLSQTGPFLTFIKKGKSLHQFEFSEPIEKVVESYGHVPLPPYIKRQANKLDKDRYQTIYANEQKAGSIAAPTAGLHFDINMLKSLTKKGVKIAKVNLHIGVGTFIPIKEPYVEDHKMHKEEIEITEKSVQIINKAKNRNGRVVCVGTTSLRCIESVCKKNKGVLKAFKGETDLFIFPGYKFEIADILITNFHLPRSSLLLLVCAFMNKKRIMSAYRHAIKKGYRFYSYGDAMFINPKEIE